MNDPIRGCYSPKRLPLVFRSAVASTPLNNPGHYRHAADEQEGVEVVSQRFTSPQRLHTLQAILLTTQFL